MAQASLAIQTGAATRSYRSGNVVSFDNYRRRSRVEHARETQSRGVVVPLPSSTGSRAPKHEISGQVRPVNSNSEQLTPIDYIASSLLLLSAFTGPALVWALLNVS
jgi:hypothetical protein